MLSPHFQLFLPHFSWQGSLPPIRIFHKILKSGYYRRNYTLASLNQKMKNLCQLGYYVKN